MHAAVMDSSRAGVQQLGWASTTWYTTGWYCQAVDVCSVSSSTSAEGS